MSATGSPPSVRLFSKEILPPIVLSMSMMADLEGLTPTLFSRILAFGCATAATIQNEAELISPGIFIFIGTSSGLGITSIALPVSLNLAPIADNILSVWSLDLAG